LIAADAANGAQMPDQAGGDEGFADIGAGTGYKDSSHGSSYQNALPHEAGEALDCSSGWPAVKVKAQPRRPGRHGRRPDRGDRNPPASRSREASRRSGGLSPSTSGTIGLRLSASRRRAVKARTLRDQGQCGWAGSPLDQVKGRDGGRDDRGWQAG
jgi:hypothetical protein